MARLQESQRGAEPPQVKSTQREATSLVTPSNIMRSQAVRIPKPGKRECTMLQA